VSAEDSWRFCQKCHALFYDGFPNKGRCCAGGGHEAAGFNFQLPSGNPETSTAQSAWRYCVKCQAMFFDGSSDKGQCPAGGAHSGGDGKAFTLPHDVSESANAQSAWRFCVRCHTMFFDGYPDKGACQGNPLPPLAVGGPLRHGGHEALSAAALAAEHAIHHAFGGVIQGAADFMFVLPHDLPEWFCLDAPSITFGTGIAVGGHGRLTVFSDGTTHFQGHLHDSGLPSYDCLAVFSVKDTDGRAYSASKSGRVHGTDEPGSRDLDWDDWGNNSDIKNNWAKIKAGATGGYRVDVTSDWSPQKIAEDVVAVVGAVLSLIPLIFSGGSSNKSSDPNYGRPEDYPPGGLPPPDQQV
jgi:hypothetical protein